MSTTTAIIILSFISGMTTLIGAVLAIFLKKSAKAIVSGVGFAAGMMFLISFGEIIPESLKTAGSLQTSISLVLGGLLIGILNVAIPHTHLIKKEEDCSLVKTAYLCALGLILHDFPEGFSMANSYLHAPNLGILVSIAIALHNIPEEFAIAVPLVLSKKKPAALLKIAFVSGLAEPAGAIVGLLAAHLLPIAGPLLMSFAAGAMIFVAIHELIPMAKKYRRSPALAAGIIFSLVVYFVLTMLFSE